MADCVPPFARSVSRGTFSRFFLFLFALSAAVVAPAAAQVRVVLTGVVTDPSGGVLPDATIGYGTAALTWHLDLNQRLGSHSAE